MMNLADPLFFNYLAVSHHEQQDRKPRPPPSLCLSSPSQLESFPIVSPAVFLSCLFLLAWPPFQHFAGIVFFRLFFTLIRLFSMRGGEQGLFYSSDLQVSFSFAQFFFRSRLIFVSLREVVFVVWMWTSVLGWANLDWLCVPVSKKHHWAKKKKRNF